MTTHDKPIIYNNAAGGPILPTLVHNLRQRIYGLPLWLLFLMAAILAAGPAVGWAITALIPLVLVLFWVTQALTRPSAFHEKREKEVWQAWFDYELTEKYPDLWQLLKATPLAGADAKATDLFVKRKEKLADTLRAFHLKWEQERKARGESDKTPAQEVINWLDLVQGSNEAVELEDAYNGTKEIALILSASHHLG